MKKFLSLLLCLMLCAPAAAYAFDTAALQETEDTYTFTHPGTQDVVVRLLNQPYIGQVNEPYEGGLVAYVDYLTLADLDITLLRLFVSIEAYEPVAADSLRVTVGGKQYTFMPDYDQSEYDGIYMEDYTLCLTAESLPLLKAIAQTKKDDPIPVELISLGEVLFAGEVIIPGDDAAALYDRYIDLGGKKQDLKEMDANWPCKIEKVK